MSKSWGHAPGAAPAPASARPDLATSEGLARHSLEHGELAAFAAVAELGVKPSAPRQSVEVFEARNGTRVVVRTADIRAEERRLASLPHNQRRQQADDDQRWHYGRRQREEQEAAARAAAHDDGEE